MNLRSVADFKTLNRFWDMGPLQKCEHISGWKLKETKQNEPVLEPLIEPGNQRQHLCLSEVTSEQCKIVSCVKPQVSLIFTLFTGRKKI